MNKLNNVLNRIVENNNKRRRENRITSKSNVSDTTKSSIDSENADNVFKPMPLLNYSSGVSSFPNPNVVKCKEIVNISQINVKNDNFNVSTSFNLVTDYEESAYGLQYVTDSSKRDYPESLINNEKRHANFDYGRLDITNSAQNNLTVEDFRKRKKTGINEPLSLYKPAKTPASNDMPKHLSEAVTFFALKKTIALINEIALYNPNDGISRWDEILELQEDAQRYINDAVMANFKNEDLSPYQLQLTHQPSFFNIQNLLTKDVFVSNDGPVRLPPVHELKSDITPDECMSKNDDYEFKSSKSVLAISSSTIDEGYSDFGAQQSLVTNNYIDDAPDEDSLSFYEYNESCNISNLDDILSEERQRYMDMINSNKISGIDLRIPKEVLNSSDSYLFERRFEFSQRLDEINKSVFGYNGFRGVQLAAINAIMLGRDCFLMMATGGGKSHCYQLPSLLLNGLVVVFSPLISLMEDQIRAIRSYGIKAETLNSKSTLKDLRELSKRLLDANEQFSNGYILFITPEKFDKSESVLKLLGNVNELNRLKLFVIDEAHCVSQWGLSFRKDYRKLSNLKLHFPKVPILAMTATATPDVMIDINNVLNLKNHVILRTTINRPNLWIEVREKTKNYVNDIIKILNNTSGCAIIYCLTTADCEKMAAKLIDSNISATVYHARLHIDERNSAQKHWKNGGIRVMVATIAFGMGIDKPDVRFVFHSSAPTSILGYYQEIGRAGRDGKFSTTILWYSFKDFERHKTLSNVTPSKVTSSVYGSPKAMFSTMREYCQNRTICRRLLLLHAFGEIFDNECTRCFGCDNCCIQSSSNIVDVTDDAITILMLISDAMKYRQKAILTLNILCDALRGSNRSLVVKYQLNESPYHGKLHHLNQKSIFQIINEMINLKVLKECKRSSMGFVRTVIVEGPNANKLLNGDISVKIICYDNGGPNNSTRKQESARPQRSGANNQTTLESMVSASSKLRNLEAQTYNHSDMNDRLFSNVCEYDDNASSENMVGFYSSDPCDIDYYGIDKTITDIPEDVAHSRMHYCDISAFESDRGHVISQNEIDSAQKNNIRRKIPRKFIQN